MSHTRRLALFLVLFAAALSTGWRQPSSAAPPANVEPVSRLVLVEGWCQEICDSQCDSGCAQARPVGCTCYWVCENEESGQQICTGDIGVRICG